MGIPPLIKSEEVAKLGGTVIFVGNHLVLSNAMILAQNVKL